jgi:trimethylamine:corrinoid methyltransferase-like protein
MVEEAKKRVERILSTHVPEPIDPDTKKKMNAVLERFSK